MCPYHGGGTNSHKGKANVFVRIVEKDTHQYANVMRHKVESEASIYFLSNVLYVLEFAKLSSNAPQLLCEKPCSVLLFLFFPLSLVPIFLPLFPHSLDNYITL